jgi:hypothetical protein
MISTEFELPPFPPSPEHHSAEEVRRTGEVAPLVEDDSAAYWAAMNTEMAKHKAKMKINLGLRDMKLDRLEKEVEDLKAIKRQKTEEEKEE